MSRKPCLVRFLWGPPTLSAYSGTTGKSQNNENGAQVEVREELFRGSGMSTT